MQKNNERSDKFKEIIDLILNDKDKGTNLFYQEYIQIITIAVRSVNPDPDKVKSAINTVLITTWQNAKNLREIRNPEGWLYVVARNCAKKENTDRWDSELTEDMHPITNAFDKIEDDDLLILDGVEDEFIFSDGEKNNTIKIDNFSERRKSRNLNNLPNLKLLTTVHGEIRKILISVGIDKEFL